MKPITLFDRRHFMKLAGAAPLLAYIAAQDLAEKALGAVGKTAGKGNIYSTIGVRSFINGRGTWTYLSGSLELPEVRAAKQAAAAHFVDIFELQHAASKRLAELPGAEAGMVTSGAAGAMASATAACMAGSDPAKIWQLPDTTGLKHEVVMHGGRSAFDSAIRLAGAKLVLAHGEDEVRVRHQPEHGHDLYHLAGRHSGEDHRHCQERRRCRCCLTMPRGFRPSRI